MTTSLYQTIIDASAPTTSTVGVVGNWYIDTSTTPPTLYLCTDATGGVYTWTEIGGTGGAAMIIGTVDPTTSTVGEVGQLYLNSDNGTLFMCNAVNNGVYTWNTFGYTNSGITIMLNSAV